MYRSKRNSHAKHIVMSPEPIEIHQEVSEIRRLCCVFIWNAFLTGKAFSFCLTFWRGLYPHAVKGTVWTQWGPVRDDLVRCLVCCERIFAFLVVGCALDTTFLVIFHCDAAFFFLCKLLPVWLLIGACARCRKDVIRMHDLDRKFIVSHPDVFI